MARDARGTVLGRDRVHAARAHQPARARGAPDAACAQPGVGRWPWRPDARDLSDCSRRRHAGRAQTDRVAPLTCRTVTTLEQAAELVDWYRCRWEIETLFHVLKNGCPVEALQLAEVKKLELALVIYLVVAWRQAHLVRLGRVHPELPASEVFDSVEWQAAWLLAEKTPPKKTPPWVKSSAASPCLVDSSPEKVTGSPSQASRRCGKASPESAASSGVSKKMRETHAL
ncbi:IS4 family transposase [Parazoarcus communis]|uniref:IS4 family transposase n=1 Tax=Parazoarcus communis TaxID=41977 RepID=UPI0024364207|nr:IS4 family transposase [Parazoarcus communis]